MHPVSTSLQKKIVKDPGFNRLIDLVIQKAWSIYVEGGDTNICIKQ